VLVGEAHDLGALVFDGPQVARILPVHGGHVVRQFGAQVGQVEAPGRRS